MEDHSVIGVPVGAAVLLTAATISHFQKKRAYAALNDDERSILKDCNWNFRTWVVCAGIGLYAGALAFANHVSPQPYVIAALTMGLGIAIVLAGREKIFAGFKEEHSVPFVRAVTKSYWLMSAGIIGYAAGISFEMIRRPFS